MITTDEGKFKIGDEPKPSGIMMEHRMVARVDGIGEFDSYSRIDISAASSKVILRRAFDPTGHWFLVLLAWLGSDPLTRQSKQMDVRCFGKDLASVAAVFSFDASLESLILPPGECGSNGLASVEVHVIVSNVQVQLPVTRMVTVFPGTGATP